MMPSPLTPHLAPQRPSLQRPALQRPSLQRPADLGPKQKAWCDRHLPTIWRFSAQPEAASNERVANADHAADHLQMSGWL